jgi:hypothetical protein
MSVFRRIFQVLALLACAAVIFQAAVVAWGFAGLGKWVTNGGVLDKATIESESMSFPGVSGLGFHAMGGLLVIPILGLLLFISSFFAKAPHARVMGAVVFGLILLQSFLGLELHEVPFTGLLHGMNALLLFMAALYAFHLSRVSLPAAQLAQPVRATRPSDVDAMPQPVLRETTPEV